MTSKLIEQFLNLIDKSFNHKIDDPLYFKELLTFDVKDGTNLIEIVKLNPAIVIENLTVNSTIFDYFYEKTLKMSDLSIWLIHFKYILTILNTVDENEKIKDLPYYIKNLQETGVSHNNVFELLFTNEFNVGDPEELIYIIIARGETNKIKTISDIYIIEDYLGIFDVAVKYGRCEIIKFLMTNLELNIEMFGKILDFENYNTEVKFKEIINITNYVKSVELILKEYNYPVTLRTLYIWCDFVNKNHCNKWEDDVIRMLSSKIEFATDDSINNDFGRFNSLIFNKEDINILNIKEQNVMLQEKLEVIQNRYTILLEHHHKVLKEVDNLNYRLLKKQKLVDNRIRSDST